MNDLKDFLNDVVEDEAEEDNLDPENKMVPSIDVAQELIVVKSRFLLVQHLSTHVTHLHIMLFTFTGLKSVRTISPPVGGISKAI